MTEDINFTRQARETVTIMRPMPSVVPRGVASFEKQQPTRSIRWKESEVEAVSDAAALLGMTYSSFVKWCAFYVALDIIQQHKEFEKLDAKKR